MKNDSRLIQRPQAQPPLYRLGWSFVTGLFWVVYAYLWIPVVTLVLGLLGVGLPVVGMYLKGHQPDPFLLTALPLMAVVTAALLIGWAELNRLRFGDRHRRNTLPAVSPAEVAAALGATPQVADALATAKVVHLEMTERATPLSVRMLTPLVALAPRTTASTPAPTATDASAAAAAGVPVLTPVEALP